MDERLKQLLMLRKEDMTMGQLFELVRYRPEEMDGYIFEQKINRTISEEFVRLQSKVDGAFSAVTNSYHKMAEFEQKIDILRAQMSRIGKFDGQIDSFTRTQQDHASQMQSLSDRLMDLFTQFRQNNEGLSKRIFKIEGDIREINKIIDEPADVKKEKKKKFDDQLDAMEMRLAQKHLELTSQFAEFQNETTKNRLDTQKIVSSLEVGFEAISEPFKQHGFTLTEHKSELEKHKKVMEELSEHVEAIKKYSQLTNLHIEAYLPFQVASQIYETCEVLAKQKLKTIFRKKFTTKIEELEQNLLNCCNPSTFGQYKSPYRKISYELPKSYLQPDIQLDEPQGDENAEKKLKLKMSKFLKEKLQRDATRDSSIENVFILFGGVSIDQLHVKIREEMFGFKYADEYIFKLNKERDKAQIQKAAADQAKGQAAPVADFGALRMQVNYELMKNKVNVEAMVKKTFSQLRDAFDVLEEKLDNRFLKVDGEKDKLNDELEKTQLKIQQAEERVSQALKKQADLEMSFSYQTTETKTFIAKNIESVFAKKMDTIKEEASAAAIQRLATIGYEQQRKSVSFDDDKRLKGQSSQQNVNSASLKEINRTQTGQREKQSKLDMPEISESARSSSLSSSSISVQGTNIQTPKSEEELQQLIRNQEREKQIQEKRQTELDSEAKHPTKRKSTNRESSNRASMRKRNSSFNLKTYGQQKDQLTKETNSQGGEKKAPPLTPSINNDQQKRLNDRYSVDQLNSGEAQQTLKIQKSEMEVVHDKVIDKKNNERTTAQQLLSGDIIEEKDETTPKSTKDLSALQVQMATSIQNQNESRQILFSQVQGQISRENSIQKPADRTDLTVQVQDRQSLNSSLNDNTQLLKVADSRPISYDEITKESEVPSPLGEQLDEEEKIVNKMKNDRINNLIQRQKQGSKRILNLRTQIQNAPKIIIEPISTEIVAGQDLMTSERLVTQTSHSPTRKAGRPDSAMSKRSKRSNASISRRRTLVSRKTTLGNLGDRNQRDSPPLKKSGQNAVKNSRENDSSNKQSDSEVDLDDDYDDEQSDVEVDMKLYLKDEVFQMFKTAQDKINQQLVEELEKRDYIIKQLHAEQAEHNTDILAFLEIVNAVDFRIMDKAEVRVNAALNQFDAMFDKFKQVITTDVKRWRQENVDMQIKVQINSLKHDHLQSLVGKMNERFIKFEDLMLAQFQNLQGLWDLQVRLNKQDDEDKKSISLIGMREKEQLASSLPARNQPQTTHAPLVSLDPKCFNCESDFGQKQIIFQKFKMACLSYKPSPIELDGGLLFSRQEIFGLQDQSLTQIRESQLLTRASLSSLNSLVNKILEDLVKVQETMTAKQGLKLLENDIKKVENNQERKLVLSQAVTASQTLDANRFAQLRKDMRTQPGSSRPIHKILVLDNISNNVIASKGANSLHSINGLATNSIGSDFQVNVDSTQIQTDRSNRNKRHMRETANSLGLPQITPRSAAISNFDSKALSTATNKARFSQTNGFQK